MPTANRLPASSVDPIAFPKTAWYYWRAAVDNAATIDGARAVARGLVDELDQLHAWAVQQGLDLPRFRATRQEAADRGWLT